MTEDIFQNMLRKGSGPKLNLPDLPTALDFSNMVNTNLLAGLSKKVDTKLKMPNLNIAANQNGLAATSAAKPPGLKVGNYLNAGMSLFTGISDISNISNSSLNRDQKNMAYGDSALNTISDAASAFGPIGSAIGGGLKLLNSIGGSLIGTPKILKDFKVNDIVSTSSGYTGVSSGAKDMGDTSKSYQSAGLVGKLFGGANKLKNKANQSNLMQAQVSDLVTKNMFAKDRASSSASLFNSNNMNKLYGGNSWNNGSMLYGKKGTRLLKKQTFKLQFGGVVYNPLKQYEEDEYIEPELNLNSAPINHRPARLSELAKRRKELEEENERLKNQVKLEQEKVEEKPVITKVNSTDKFSSFEQASTNILQSLYPGKKVEVTYEKTGVYAPDGSRDWTTQADLKAKGASKTGLSLHNFGAAKDYRLIVDGKTIDVGNTKLYKDVLWKAAQDTGLYTVGDWDVAHIGLAPEGQGKTWDHLAQHHPEIFQSERAKDTLAKLQKAGESKYLAQLAKPLEVAMHKQGGTLSNKNVIVHGALHAHKHTLKELEGLEEAAITLKGIPVITKDAEGGILQHSEIEIGELILHYDLTMKLEELRKIGDNEATIEAGKLLAKELMRNTSDKTRKILSAIKNG